MFFHTEQNNYILFGDYSKTPVRLKSLLFVEVQVSQELLSDTGCDNEGESPELRGTPTDLRKFATTLKR